MNSVPNEAREKVSVERVATIIAGAVTGVLLAPVVAPAVVGVVGFGAAGPVAGTH